MGNRVEISKKLLLINSASTVCTRLLNITVLVWLYYYLLGRITPEEYSLLPVVGAVMMFAPLLTTVLTGGIGRFVIEAYARNDDERITQITSTMAPLLAVAGSIFLLCGWTFAWNVGDLLDISPELVPDARMMLAMSMFSVAIQLPFAPFGVGLHVRQRFVLINVFAISCDLARLAMLFSLLFCVSTRVLWVITASTFADVLYLILIQIWSRRAVPALRFKPSKVHWPIAGELMSFGGWSSLANLADTVRTSADPIILNKLATPIDVACYALGSMVTQRISVLSNAVRGPMLPALTAMHATNDWMRMQGMFLRGGRIALWLVMLPAIPLMIFNQEVVALYAGAELAQAGTVMFLSLMFLPISYGTTMTTAIVNARGKIKTWALIVAAMNSLNLILTFYFVGGLKMGAIGSAAATLVSVVVFYPLFVYPFGLRLVGVSAARWYRETMIPGLLPALGSALVTLAVKFNVEAGSWLALGLAVTPGTLVYLTGVFMCLREEDRSDLRRVRQRAWAS